MYRTGDQNWSYSFVRCNAQYVNWKGMIAAQVWAGHWSSGAEQLCSHYLSLLGFVGLVLFWFFFSPLLVVVSLVYYH